MSTLKTHNLQSPDSGSANVALAPNAGMVVTGISTFTDVIDIHKDSTTTYDATADAGQRTDSASITLRNDNGSTNTFSQLVFDTGGTNQSIARIVAIRKGSATNDLAIVTEHNNTKAERLRITSAGKIGIGTDNPKQWVSMNSGRVSIDVRGDYYGAWIDGDTQGTSAFNVGRWHNAGGRMRSGGSSDNDLVVETQNTSHNLQLQPSGGNVGIGTNNPTTELQVNAASNESTISLFNGGTKKSAFQASNSFGTIIYSYDSEPLVFSVASGTSFSEKVRIDSNGYLIAKADIRLRRTASDNGALYFGDTNNNYIFGSDADDVITFATANNERLRITSGGQVRIGNSDITTASAADDLIIGPNTPAGDHGITIFSGTSGTGNIYFGDTNTSGTGNRMGTISYYHNGNYMRFSTNGNQERLRIDSNGYVTKPNNAMFKVQRTSNQGVGSNGWHIIQFNNDSTNGCFDIGNNFTTSNHRFTAPVNGYYHFGLNQRVDGGDTSYFRVAFSVNGSVGSSDNYPHGHAIYRDANGFPYYSFSISTLIYLTAGQYVRAEAYSHTDTSWTLQDESIFYGYLVG